MAGLWTCIKAAFSARPLGMPVPPNWIFLAAVGMVGLVIPGVWLIGAGLEIAYLAWLATNERFVRVVDSQRPRATAPVPVASPDALLGRLDPLVRQRHEALVARCQEILQRQQAGGDASGIENLNEGLSRLLWIHLNLLTARGPIEELVQGDARATARELQTRELEQTLSSGKLDGELKQKVASRLELVKQRLRTDVHSVELERRAKELEERLAGKELSEDLRKSLVGQLEIVKQRQDKRREAKEKLAFLDAELTRLSEQVELLREQAMLAQDPRTVSDRVDAITSSLSGTSDWIVKQQRMMGQIEDAVNAPPPLLSAGPAKERA